MKAASFFKGLSWLLVLNLLIKPAWIFVIDRQVQNIVGQETYGRYFALFNLTYVLLFIADAGLSNMLTQRLAANGNLNVRQLLKAKLLLLLVYALVCFMIASGSGIRQWNILLLLVAVQCLNSFFVFLRSLLTARQLFQTDAWFSVLDKSLLLLLCVGPVYGYFTRITIPLYLQLQVLSSSVAVAGLCLLLYQKKLFAAGEKLAAKTVVAWLIPFILIVVLMSVHNRLDAFLLERMRTDGALQAGIYAMAYRLLDAANMIGYLTASFLVPFLSRHQGNTPLVQQVLLLARHGLLLTAAVVVGFVAVFAPWLLLILYHVSTAYYVDVMRLCMAVLPAYFLLHIYGSALTAAAAFRLLIQLLFGAVLLNVLLNLWLIPQFGAKGCCMAALASQYACALAVWFAASRKLAVSPAFGSALLYPVAAVMCGGLFAFGQKLTSSVWIILSSIALVAFVLLLVQRNFVKKLFYSFIK